MKFVVSLSGGMDSTTLLYDLLIQKHTVAAISFNYGQRHSKELTFARATCEKWSIPHEVVSLASLRPLLSRSALTGDLPMPHGHYEDAKMKLTVVPNRNMILLAIALGWAANLEYDMVALAAHSGDHAIYPDCRPEFIEAMDRAAQIATYQPLRIYTPYLHKTKREIAQIGHTLGVNYDQDTWTCYEGLETSCGKCGACVERAEALAA